MRQLAQKQMIKKFMPKNDIDHNIHTMPPLKKSMNMIKKCCVTDVTYAFYL